MPKRRARPTVASAAVYDTGALVAAERNDRRIWKIHKAMLRNKNKPIVPVVVVAQAWRGGPQASLSRLLRGCRIEPDDEAIGRAAGTACGAAGTADVVDAIVVVTALNRGAAVYSSDPDDLKHIANSINRKLTVVPV
jgi:hypothetical protein